MRQTVDRVAEVLQIAIRKRHVTPRLSGAAYAVAAARVGDRRPPPGARTGPDALRRARDR